MRLIDYRRGDLGRVSSLNEADYGLDGPARRWAKTLVNIDAGGHLRVIAVGGAQRDHDRMATLWGACGPGMTPRGWALVRRHVRAMVDEMMARGAYRVQAMALNGHDAGRRFLDGLGLKDEVQVWRAYGPDGSDYYVRARIGDEA